MFEFAMPWVLMLLPLPWILRKCLPAAKIKQSDALYVPFYKRMETVSQGEGRYQYKRSPWQFLAYVVWFCLLLACAGPQWLGKPIEISREGRNIMLALDISGSMKTADMEWQNNNVDRLTVVRHVAKQFTDNRQGDRLGLILFGSRAYLQTPLTFDRKTIDHMLEDATIGLAGPQTAIGDAIGLAVKRLKKASEKNRVLILLTDGAHNAGTVGPIQAAKIAKQNHIKIYTIGLGAERLVVPGLLGPHIVNPSAQLDEGTLQTIAKITGGVFFRARDTHALQSIYQKIHRLEPVAIDKSVYRPVTAYYYIPLFIALLISCFLSLLAIARAGYLPFTLGGAR